MRLKAYSQISKSVFHRIVNKIIDRGIIKLQPCSRREGVTLPILWYLSSLNICCFSQCSTGILIMRPAYPFCCFQMKLLTSDVQHITWTFSLMSLYQILNPPLIILLRRLQYVTSNFSNWLTSVWVCCGKSLGIL